ncbi:DUF58 domain-containing protein [Magnetospirillum moscoviense]|uniref:DUF58 domain-containing protein n=1 Tax=Magnetospirillum moscoviense TaxID=1437059 RepID=A0A178MYV7_9PROT|nr:DUF58 domain-containing protein [Magnetospirillum moscoviense]OAN55128.1 hypothetical protein A6A05_00785 [Magnetospirillum moscoviense]
MTTEGAARQLAARLPPLLVAAERVAAAVTGGAHGRRRAGPGESFWQFRHAQTGDPASAIDWRQSARGQDLFVRQTEWAAAQTVWLWCDGTASMEWRSDPNLPTKAERALVLTLALAACLLRGGERVAAAGWLPTGHGPQALSRLAAALAATPAPPAAPPPKGVEMVLVSDFLEPLDMIAARVRAWAGGRAGGHLLQVLDPAEETLPFDGRIRFTDPESGAEFLARRAQDLRDGYQQRMTAHRDGLVAIARAAGWSFSCHHSDQPPQTALLALYRRLASPRNGLPC